MAGRGQAQVAAEATETSVQREPPKRTLNVIPSPEGRGLDVPKRAGADMIATARRPSPARALDQRPPGGLWKINDQKSTGSCVGWATADAVLRRHRRGGLPQNHDGSRRLHLDGFEGDRPVHRHGRRRSSTPRGLA